MASYVHLGKWTHVSNTCDLDREIAEEIHNLEWFVSHVETQDEGGDQWTQ